MRESRQSGSVRGALSNERPYRDSVALARLRHVAVYAETAILTEFSHVARPPFRFPP
jgi:hypothetical protein